jgi:hypothetical protein
VSDEKIEPLERLLSAVTERFKGEDVSDEDARKAAEKAVESVLESGYKITEPEAQLEFGFAPDDKD